MKNIIFDDTEDVLEYLEEKCEEIFSRGEMTELEEEILSSFRDRHYVFWGFDFNEEAEYCAFGKEISNRLNINQMKRAVKSIFAKHAVLFHVLPNVGSDDSE